MGSLGGGVVAAKKKAMWLYPKVLGFNPSERWGHSACYSQGIVYVFGGCCGGLHFADVLTLNLNTMAWNTLVTTGEGPGPRDSHSAVLVGHRMIVFGGTNGSKKVNDLHVLELGSNEWTWPECTGAPPSPRESHTATLVGDQKLVIFGGSGEGEGNYLNDLHVLDLKCMRWTSPEVKGDIPAPRDSHSAVAIGNKLFVYGGDCGDRYHGDVDMFDMDTATWSRLALHGCSPGVRAGHAAVNMGTKIFVIGGVGDKRYYNDVWVLDVIAFSWSELEIRGQQPQGRFSHTAIVTNSDIVIYGGCGEDERPLNELLVLQLGAEHPNGRYNISLCKMFGSHWSQGKRRFLREPDNKLKPVLFGDKVVVTKEAQKPELESKLSFGFTSDTSHPKRRRTIHSKAVECESEQEEHSLSLSQHSSPSQSDQEQTPSALKGTDSVTASQGFPMFKFQNQILNSSPIKYVSNNQMNPSNITRKTPQDFHFLGEPQNRPKSDHFIHMGRQESQYLFTEQKVLEAAPIQNLIGAEVRGKVDGAFDSGYLMTATVNGKVFRGVLFAPGVGAASGGALGQNPLLATSQNAAVRPFQNSHRIEPTLFKPSKQATAVSATESGPSFRQAQVNRTCPVIRTSSPSLKVRSDLQGVVLTLGGPGSSHG